MEDALAANGTATLASTKCSLYCTDLIGGLAVHAASLPSDAVCMRSLQGWAKWLRQVMRGHLAHQWELALRIMELDLSLEARKRFVFRHYAGHSLSLQTGSKGDNWRNDLDDSGSPKHWCKVLCHLMLEEFINYCGIIRMVSTLPPCPLCTNNVCFLILNCIIMLNYAKHR